MKQKQTTEFEKLYNLMKELDACYFQLYYDLMYTPEFEKNKERLLEIDSNIQELKKYIQTEYIRGR